MRTAAACALAVLAGCAAVPGGAPVAPPAGPRAQRSEALVSLPRTVVTAEGAASIPELYERALELRQREKWAEAAQGFDRVAILDPDGALAAEALLLAGDCHDRAGALETALARYAELARRYAGEAHGHEGLVRSLRVLCYLERWERASVVAELLLAPPEQSKPHERILALGARAMDRLARGDEARAEYLIEKARDIIDEHRLDQAGRISADLVLTYYALGEVRRAKASRIRFDPVPANFAAVLERRCELILSAQSAYSDAMRAYDAHWSAMAGYRVGELYESLHEDLMDIPPPRNAASEKQKQLFEGAMRLRYAVLLRKARSMMEHTLSMATRTGERSAWVARAEAALRRIGEAEAREQQALDRLPYTRAEFEEAFARLAAGGAI